MTVSFEVDGKELSGLIDIGASSNVILLHVVQGIWKDREIKPCRTKVQPLLELISVKGQIIRKCTAVEKRETQDLEFVVTETVSQFCWVWMLFAKLNLFRAL